MPLDKEKSTEQDRKDDVGGRPAQDVGPPDQRVDDETNVNDDKTLRRQE